MPSRSRSRQLQAATPRWCTDSANAVVGPVEGSPCVFPFTYGGQPQSNPSPSLALALALALAQP